MRPIELTMSAFGPYADCQTIPFYRYGSGGIYLISGETGAGKTSIFDGISFALYGKASGRDRTGSMLRSDFAQPGIKTFVRFTFSCQDKTYTVERKPDYQRPKARGKGTTREAAEAQLTLPDGSIVSGLAAVTEKVEEIMGLNREQFSQIVMIAQGEFRKLLLSNTSDRAEILRKIFATGPYKQFQEQLKQRMREAQQGLAAAEQSFLQYANGITVEGSQKEALCAWKAQAGIHRAGELLELLTVILEEGAAEILSCKQNFARQQALSAALAERLSLVTQDNRQLEALDRQRQALDKLENGRPEQEKRRESLRLGLLALRQVRPSEQALERASAALSEASASTEAAQYDLEDKLKACQRATEAYEQVQAQSAQREELRLGIEKLRGDLPSYEQLSRLKAESLSLDEQLRLCEKRMAELHGQNEAGEARCSQLRARLEDLSGVALQKEKLERDHEQVKQKGLDLGAFLADFACWQEKETELEGLQQSFLMAETVFTDKEDQYRRTERSFLHEQAGILAKGLLAGQACPVCGAKEHPNPAVLVPDAPTEEAVRLARQDAERSREKRDELHSQCSAARAAAAQMEEALGKRAARLMPNAAKKDWARSLVELSCQVKQREAQLAKEIKTADDDLMQQETSRATLTKLEREQQDRSIELTVLADEQKQMEIQKSRLDGEQGLQEARLTYESLKSAQEALLGKERLLRALQDAYEAAAQDYEAAQKALSGAEAVLVERKQALTEKQAERQASETAFHQALTEHNFAGLQAYKEALLPEEALQGLEETVAAFERAYDLGCHELRRLERACEDKAFLDPAALQRQQQEQEAEMKALAERLSHLQSGQDHVAAGAQNLREVLKQLGEQEKSYLQLKRLSDTANGEISGKARVSFETYLQMSYFSRILKAANQRFSVMSNQRYELCRREEAGDLRRASGLELDVLDHYTGKLRDVRTLSGGESFEASLALALGLSDVVQQTAGGIALDAMFIDEGFGSLDAESLDTAIKTLQSMAGDRRMVGIISHVSELSSRIEQKILIKRGRQGSEIHLAIE